MKRRVIRIVFTGAVVVVAAVLLWPREREPEYQGKKLSEWLEQYETFASANGPANHPAMQEAAGAIRAIGTNAIPYLVKWIRYETPRWRDTLKDTVDKLPSFLRDRSIADKVTTDRVENRADRVALGFAILGESGSIAVPQLASFLDDPKHSDTAWRALTALPALGKNGMAIILERMRSANPSVRCDAVKAMVQRRNFETNASAAVPLLINALQSTNDTEAMFAAAALGQLQLQPDLVVPALVGTLKGMSVFPEFAATDTVFMCALNKQSVTLAAIGNFGAAARAAVPRLREIAENPNDWLRAAASNCLQRIESKVVVRE